MISRVPGRSRTETRAGLRHATLFACLSAAMLLAPVDRAFAVTDAVVRTTQQGVHSWKAGAGRLFMVAGTYQDTTSYRRSMAFYFQENDKGDWLQVPVAQGKVDLATDLTTASRGETTLRDATVVPRGKNIYLIIADRLIDKPTITVRRYKFSDAGEDYPDAPGMLFIPVSTATYQVAKLKTVEAVLDTEIAALPGN